MKNTFDGGSSNSVINHSVHQQPGRKEAFLSSLKSFPAQTRKGLSQLRKKMPWMGESKRAKPARVGNSKPAVVESTRQHLEPCLAMALIELASDSPTQLAVFCGFLHCFKKLEDENILPNAQILELLLNLDNPTAKVILERLRGDFGKNMEIILEAEIQAWNTEYGSSFQSLYQAVIQLRKDLVKALLDKLGQPNLPVITLTDRIAMKSAEIAAGRYCLNQAYLDAFGLRQHI